MKYNGISILGSDRFIKQTVRALEIIKDKSKKDHNKITKYLKSIQSAKFSGMDLEKAQFNAGKPTVFGHSVDWYASSIVHDVHHFYLHSTKRLLWKQKNFRRHEKLCITEQVRFLRKIGAPKYVINHCKGALKTKYWEIEKRSW